MAVRRQDTMTSQPVNALEQLWQEFVALDRQHHAARMELLRDSQSGALLLPVLRKALGKVDERAAALRLLAFLDESVRRELLPELVYLAAFGHRDIRLVRDVILTFDQQWLEDHLPREIEHVLQGPDPYEEYRRFAELLRLLRSPYLETLLGQAAANDNPDIQEVAEDFGSPGNS